MVPLQQFEATLVRFIQPVPWFVAEPALRDTFQQMCKSSYCWLHANAVDATHGNMAYPLTALPDCRINAIVAAALDGRPLIQGQDFELSDEQLVLKKVMTGHIKLSLSLYPTSTAMSMPEELFERFRVAICQGVAAELGQNEKAEWALTKNQVAAYQEAFDLGCSEARHWALNKANRLYEQQTRHFFY